jgi:glycosyltransferase involved in cell wall biosynthesis
MYSLSVVILTYNCASTIRDTLDSLVQQYNRDFDVVLVDDDSADNTIAIAMEFRDLLQIKVVRNGTHNIPRGRNIGLEHSSSAIVAFLDSDDTATPSWTEVIVDCFKHNPEVAGISGSAAPAHRTRVAQAIAMNDHAVRRTVGRGGTFSAGNCAINRTVFADARFDEDFRFAEDLEMMARIAQGQGWLYVPEMRINYFSRNKLSQYATQMHNYGFMKLYFAYYARTFRWVDFVPLAVILGGAIASIVTLQWWPALLILPFSLLETIAVVALERSRPLAATLSLPAWVVKNFSWSWGLVRATWSLATSPDTRRLLRSKRHAPVTSD